MRILRTHIKPRRVTDQELEPLYLERESTPLRYQIDHDGMWHSCALSNELFLDTHQHTPQCVDNHQITTTIDPQRKEPPVSKAVTRHFLPPQNQRNKKKLSIFNISLRQPLKIGFQTIFDYRRVDFIFERGRNAVHCNRVKR